LIQIKNTEIYRAAVFQRMVSEAGTEAILTEVLLSLAARGLRGVKLVIAALVIRFFQFPVHHGDCRSGGVISRGSGGRSVPLLVNQDRCRVWSPPHFLRT
jgi:hypothetical protein